MYSKYSPEFNKMIINGGERGRDYSNMSQPFSNSEAMKWIMTSLPLPRPRPPSVGIHNYVKPPFATSPNETGRQQRRAVYQQNGSRSRSANSVSQLHSSLYRRSITQSDSCAAAKRTCWPSYNSLNDPHMSQYFLRRFGRCQTPITSKSFATKSESSRSSTSRLSQVHLRSRSQIQSNTSVLYKVSLTTGDKPHCGTEAKIYITVNGTYGKIKKTHLFKKKSHKLKNTKRPFQFSKDSTHTFKISNPDIGEIKSILIENSGSKKEDAWFLNRIELTNMAKKKCWSFPCYQWLSLFHGDGHSERKLVPQKLVKTEYKVVIVTGDVTDAGTNANVYITLYGKHGVSKKKQLKSKKVCFQRNQSDTFRFKTDGIDPLVKVCIEHDNTGFSPGWFLERVVVTNVKGNKIPYYFPCGKWLSLDEEGGSISRNLIGSKNPFSKRKDNIYDVTIYTGNVKGAGTDASVFITLFGEFSNSGERRLKNGKNNFQRGRIDQFIVKCPCLGHLERIRIGHDDSGFGSGWFLEKVIIDDKDQGRVYKFLCNRWLAKDEDDGQIYRDLFHSANPNASISGCPFIITVVTGEMKHAGTNSNVFVCLYDSKKQQNCSGKIWLKDGKFERGKTDVFNITVPKAFSPLRQLEIGHDNSGRAPGWFLDHVIVDCPSTGIKQIFSCNRWLASDEDDGLIQRKLYEQKSLRKTAEQMFAWSASVYTGKKNGAGTDANVSLVVYGDNGKSDQITLDNKNDNFEKGSTDQFTINTTDIGIPYKIRIWHDNSGRFSAWFLEKVELENIATKKQYTFYCSRWLATDEDDNQILRELPATGKGIKKALAVINYKIEVYTGDVRGAGTDANIFLNIFGTLGDTGERMLANSKTNNNKFERGKMDEFVIEAVTIMEIKKIRIGHESKSPGSGWYLNKVIITESNTQHQPYIFLCNRWFAVDEDDGATVREISVRGSQMLKATTYHIQTKTGDVRGAGTDANVFIQIFGTKNDTGILKLVNSENHNNKFEQGHIDKFNIEAADIGEIEQIKIGHDSSNLGADWFLDDVQIDIPSKGIHYFFACHSWLAKDGQTEILLKPSRKENREKFLPYEVTIWTGKQNGAGTDANVFIRLFGKKGKTEKYFLKNKTNNFEAGMIDKFKIETHDVGQLLKIQIGHDGKSAFSGWFLEKLLIQHLKKSNRQEKSSATSENNKNKSHSMNSSSQQSKTVGEKREEKETKDQLKEYWFFVNRWFSKDEDDGAIIREFVPTDAEGKPLRGTLQEIEYTMKVMTGDVFGAGTDANVFVNIYGEQGDTGERQLSKSDHINKFERNQEDVFTLKAVDLGKIEKLKIYHDNKGGSAAWFLDSIEIINNSTEQCYLFPCQRWLSTKDDDGQISRVLVPLDKSMVKNRSKSVSLREEIGLETKAAITTYYIKVVTGNVWGAGTDANVYIILYGDKENTGQMWLKSSLHSKNKFEKGNTDEFVLEAVDIGELKKIKIGHDNAGYGGAWFLAKVIIDCPSLGKTWTFQCERWLALDKDDGKLEKELCPQEMATKDYEACIPYEITTYTGDVSGASTDANVFIVLYGKMTATTQKMLCANKKERKQKFKRNAVDKCVVELEDVGDEIEKIRIGHDDSGFAAGWFLAKVDVRKLNSSGKGSQTFSFPCNRWLARDEDDGSIERELVPDKLSQEVLGKNGKLVRKESAINNQLAAKNYTVCVYTGDVRGAGTDANVFITIFGDKGDTGERKLLNSQTYKNKFERNQMDRFTLEAVDLGKIYKIHIRHDNTMISPAWNLEKVEVTEETEFSSEKTSVFHCERWLAKNKDDGKIERTLYVKGYDGDMSSCMTLNSQSVSKFGSVSSMESLKSSNKSSHLNKQMAQSLENVPEGSTIPYTFRIRTGDQEDHGTNSNVWIKVFGPKKKNTGCLFMELADKEQFEPSSVETVSVEAIDVDEIKKIEVGHDGTSASSGWFLKDIEIDLPTKGKHYHFVCNDWLARDKADGQTVKTFSLNDTTNSVVSYKAMVPYEVTLHTGDYPGAGTDSKIFLTVFGERGTSKVIELEKRENYFERGQINSLKIELDDISPLKKIRMSIDGAGDRPDWYLEQVDLFNLKSGEKTIFLCEKWFSASKDDKKLTRDFAALDNQGKHILTETSYEIKVKTSDISGAGTNAGVSLILFGMNGDSNEISLTKPVNNNSNPFERGQLDIFKVNNILSLGKLSKLRIWHNNKGIGSAWHLAFIEVVDINTGSVYTFRCDKWLSKSNDDGQIIRELTCSEVTSLGVKKKTEYSIKVITTDKKDAGTNHNGWLILEAERNISKVFHMVNSPRQKIFSRGSHDDFSFESEPLGRLTACTVGAVQSKSNASSNSNRDDKWHCEEIWVTDQTDGTKYVFVCKSWIDVSSKISQKTAIKLKVTDFKESQVSLIRKLDTIKYEIQVFTGNVKNSGTNANVFLTIFGEHGDTGKRPLKQRFRDLFERNQTDSFTIESVDLGALTSLLVEHDNSGFHPGWFLDHIDITNTKLKETTSFPCQKWLDKDKEDGLIARKLLPQSQ